MLPKAHGSSPDVNAQQGSEAAADFRPTFVILSQVYVPDPAAVGQYIADVAAEMARRGYRTIVYAARNGYEDPDRLYTARERLGGVEVRRLPWSSFGKASFRARLLAQGFFLAQATARALFTRRLCGLLVSTSPPTCGVAGAILSWLRRVPVTFWVMDLNPDQLVALKVLPPGAWPVKLFDILNRIILRQARQIIVLDRFMAQRVAVKQTGLERKICVRALWPLSPEVHDIEHAHNPFRRAHVNPLHPAMQPAETSQSGCLPMSDGRFVLMYSGLHTAANPLTTLLDAAQRAHATHPQLQLICVGGGAGKQDIEARIRAGAGQYLTSLPYQPLAELRWSLSAADVHVVSMGADMVGIIHPCKVYGAMAVSRPLLLLGPEDSHIGELIATYRCGWHIPQGDARRADQVLRLILKTPREELRAMGWRAAQAVKHHLSRSRLLPQLCDVLDQGVPRPAQKPSP